MKLTGRFTRRLLLLMCAAGAVVYGDEGLPPRVAVQALLKVLTYDRNFQAHGSGDFVVLLVHEGGQSGLRERVLAATQELAGSRIQGRALQFVEVELSGEAALRDAVERARPSALMVLPSVSDAGLSAVARLARERRLYTLALDPQLVEKAVAVGVSTREGQPQILLNAVAAQQLQAEFDPAVLRLAKVFNSGGLDPDEGLIPPVQLEARPIQYTKEAIRARAEGMMSVRCVVTVAGLLEQCQVMRSVPLMEKAVLDALASRRYRPAMYRGQPIAVEKSFDIWMVVPRK